MGKILGYHHIMFILLSADVAFCYRMLSAAIGPWVRAFGAAQSTSDSSAFFLQCPRVVCVCVSHDFSSAGRYSLDIFGASVPVRLWQWWWQDWSDWSMVTMSRTMQFLKTFCAWPIQGVLVLPMRPYCSKHSRTTLRSPGPPPSHVRLIEDIISQPAAEKPWSNVWSGIWLVDSWRVTPIFDNYRQRMVNGTIKDNQLIMSMYQTGPKSSITAQKDTFCLCHVVALSCHGDFQVTLW